MLRAILLLSAVLAATALPVVSATLHLPPGHVLVGRVVDGEWSLDALPPGDARAVGAEPAYDCVNDDVASSSWYPLSANLAFPAAPNLASAGHCDGGRGLAGPVVYLAFSDTGDSGGRVVLMDAASSGWYEIACQHHASSGPAASAAATGVGAASEWRVLHDGTSTSCLITTMGPKPSEFKAPQGWVLNGNARYGVTYAAFTVAGVGL